MHRGVSNPVRKMEGTYESTVPRRRFHGQSVPNICFTTFARLKGSRFEKDPSQGFFPDF